MVAVLGHTLEPMEIVFYISVIFLIIYAIKFRNKEEYEFVGIGEEDLILLRKRYRRFYNKREAICRKIMEELFHSPFPTIRPSFLKYPLTGRNLELDCYNPRLRIALEYQGEQHYNYMPRIFHNSHEDFIGQQNRDNFKYHRCIQLGIKLVRVPYTIPTDKLKSFIREELAKFGVKV